MEAYDSGFKPLGMTLADELVLSISLCVSPASGVLPRLIRL